MNTEKDNNIEEKKAPPGVRALSAVHILYLVALPTLANFTVVPAMGHTIEKVAWFVFGVLCMPLMLVGILLFNKIPMNPWKAALHILFLPLATAVWWWFQEGTVLYYFMILFVFESMAILLSLFIMSFIPLKYYDPDNPKVNDRNINIKIFLFHGLLMGCGFMTILSVVMWRWWTTDPFWYHPVTVILLLTAAVEYLFRNFQYQLHKEEAQELSIETLILLAPVIWFISWILMV